VAPAIRVEAHPPVTAPVFAREVCRGNLCGKTFTAPTPPGAGTQKDDPSVGVMVGLLRQGGGCRSIGWNGGKAVWALRWQPPPNGNWSRGVARVVQPVGEHLAFLAAPSPTVFNDDTTRRVSDLRRQIQAEIQAPRTGIFTTGIVANAQGQPIALFVTGRQHARGESR
jgi:hypothetical protein